MNAFSKANCAAFVAAAVSLSAAQSQAAVIPGLFNTGVDDSGVALVGGDGIIDTHYSIVASSTPGFVGNQAVTFFNGAYAPQDADSRWVSLAANGTPNNDGGGSTATYRLSFNLTGLDAATAVITGLFAADNSVTVFLNGANTGFTNPGFGFLAGFTLNSGFNAGVNTLDFAVTDFGPPTALRVDNLAGRADLAPTGVVPEPATWAMMILGLGFAGSALRGRRRAGLA